MNRKAAIVLLIVLALAVSEAFAAAEAKGKVEDADGNPLQGAVVTFVNPARPETEYTAETNKKGRYWISGLLYVETSKRWDVRVEAEGYVLTHVDVTSRTQQAVLDKFETKLSRGQKIPPFMVGGFGEVTLDAVMTPDDQVAEAAPAATPTEAVVVSEAQQPATDPWDAAVRKAAGGDLDGSVELFEKALEKTPDDAEKHAAFAKVLYQLERYGPAAKQAMKATRLAPDSLEGHMVLYSVYVATNNLAGAAGALEQARTIAPDDMRVLTQVAYLAEQSGDPTTAIAAYESIVAVKPDFVDGWIALGDLYAQSGNTQKSEQAFQRVVELNPDDAYQVFFNIGALIINRSSVTESDTRKAVEAFRRAIEIKPDYAQAHQELTYALIGAGDLEGAGESIKRYLKLFPDARDAGDMRALLQELSK